MEVQRLTKSYQEWEQQGLGRSLRYVETPWPGFRQDVLLAYEKTFVARPERRRARGEGHAATVRQVKQRDGKTVVYERTQVEALTVADLERIKDPSRNAPLIAAVRDWIARGKPMNDLPRSPTGHEIRKVRLKSKDKPAVSIRGGTAGRGNFVRLDLFVLPGRRGSDEYYLVPIYPHNVVEQEPPKFYMSTNGQELPLSPDHRFKLSIYNRSFMQIEKKDGTVLKGYVVSFDRSVAALKIAHHATGQLLEKNTGVKTLARFAKYNVDRFGDLFEVRGEVRTWRGEACTLPTPAS